MGWDDLMKVILQITISVCTTPETSALLNSTSISSHTKCWEHFDLLLGLLFAQSTIPEQPETIRLLVTNILSDHTMQIIIPICVSINITI